MSGAYRVPPGKTVHLHDYDPNDTCGLARDQSDRQLADLNPKLTALQEMHYAAGQNGILIVLQGLDTAGKDGTIRHAMAQFNPSGCRVESFKVPTPEELAHDFLWRAHKVTPPKGTISIFNRSYYEDVLVVRVHNLAPKSEWSRRYDQINAFEELLADSGTIVIKFFLYISKDEQRRRLLEREADKDKAWKLSTSDWTEHGLFDAYTEAYEDALSRCSTERAPWYLVPANHKWCRNLVVAHTIVDVLKPYQQRWHKDLEERGREQLAAIAAMRKTRSTSAGSK